MTTKEIANSVSQASIGIREINANISNSLSVSEGIAGEISIVNRDAGEMSENSSNVKANAEDLSMLASTLQEKAETFNVLEDV